jgi:hypothetical protein
MTMERCRALIVLGVDVRAASYAAHRSCSSASGR